MVSVHCHVPANAAPPAPELLPLLLPELEPLPLPLLDPLLLPPLDPVPLAAVHVPVTAVPLVLVLVAASLTVNELPLIVSVPDVMVTWPTPSGLHVYGVFARVAVEPETSNVPTAPQVPGGPPSVNVAAAVMEVLDA
jgi:hypothetical protein